MTFCSVRLWYHPLSVLGMAFQQRSFLSLNDKKVRITSMYTQAQPFYTLSTNPDYRDRVHAVRLSVPGAARPAHRLCSRLVLALQRTEQRGSGQEGGRPRAGEHAGDDLHGNQRRVVVRQIGDQPDLASQQSQGGKEQRR